MADLTQEQQEQEEFEFRARAEAEEAARKQLSPAEGAVSPEGPGVMSSIVGGLKTAYDVGAPLIAEHPVATGYAASYIPGLNKLPVIRDIKAGREAVGNIAQRASNFAQNMAGGSPSPVNTPVGTPASPIGAQSTPSARTVPVSGAVAPESVPVQRVAPQAAGMAAPKAQMAAQAARTAAPAEASMMARAGQLASQYAPAMRAGLGMAGRVAGPAGLAMGAYNAGQMARETGLGSRLAGGEAQRAPQAFTGMLNRNVSGYTPTAQEARNILASKDERTINMYGGRLKLQGLASSGPNAFNSGFAQQLNRLG